MTLKVDKEELNNAIIELFGQDIRNVESIYMAKGEVVITYWLGNTDRSRKVIDTYLIEGLVREWR